MRLRRRLTTLLALALGAGCGSSPSTPTPTPTPTPAAPQLSCQSDVAFTIAGNSQVVTFSLPTPTGGSTPVAVACVPASGTAFPIGSTTVTCAAKDAIDRVASCTFKVGVFGFPLVVKRFQAVGDSLTAGENGLPQPLYLDVPNSYPSKLRTLMDTRFPSQGMLVINRGLGGRRVEETLADLPGFLQADQPEAVLILSGYNNLTVPCAAGFVDVAACDEAVDWVEINLRDMIRRAREFSTVRYVFISTMTPSRPGNKAIDNSAIRDMNDHIRAQAAAEGAFLVDVHPVFFAHEFEYVSSDGLHLLPPGYQAIADTFFSRILATIPTTTSSLSNIR